MDCIPLLLKRCKLSLDNPITLNWQHDAHPSLAHQCNSKGGYLAEVDGEAGKQYYSDVSSTKQHSSMYTHTLEQDFTQETVRSIQFRYGTAEYVHLPPLMSLHELQADRERCVL